MDTGWSAEIHTTHDSKRETNADQPSISNAKSYIEQ